MAPFENPSMVILEEESARDQPALRTTRILIRTLAARGKRGAKAGASMTPITGT